MQKQDHQGERQFNNGLTQEENAKVGGVLLGILAVGFVLVIAYALAKAVAGS